MVEMLVCQHNMRYLATSDLLDVGRDCCCFAEGGPGVDEQYSGAAPDQPNGDVTERQPAAMHAVGQALPVEVHNRKGNAPPNLLITRAITEGCSRVRPVKPDKENIMRAVVITKHGDPSVLQVRQRPDPPPPGPGQLRVAVRAAGVNFADHLARVGLYPDAPKLPAVVGYEVAGTVEAVGDGVDPNRVGERVLAGTRFGGYCEIVNVAATDSVVLPDALSFEQGAGGRDWARMTSCLTRSAAPRCGGPTLCCARVEGWLATGFRICSTARNDRCAGWRPTRCQCCAALT